MTGPVWAVVLAAGRGERFGDRKQFAHLGGERLVDRVVRTAGTVCDGVVVVLPPGRQWDGPEVARRVDGGTLRADSVRAGLAAVPSRADVVVIADAAHPLASGELYRRLVRAVRDGADGAVPTAPTLEIIQRVREGRVVATLPKDGLFLTQTPHAFRASVLRAAHLGGVDTVDDSTLLLARGRRVVAVPGEPWNLHVSTPEELAVLERVADAVPSPAS